MKLLLLIRLLLQLLLQLHLALLLFVFDTLTLLILRTNYCSVLVPVLGLVLFPSPLRLPLLVRSLFLVLGTFSFFEYFVEVGIRIVVLSPAAVVSIAIVQCFLQV